MTEEFILIPAGSTPHVKRLGKGRARTRELLSIAYSVRPGRTANRDGCYLISFQIKPTASSCRAATAVRQNSRCASPPHVSLRFRGVSAAGKRSARAGVICLRRPRRDATEFLVRLDRRPWHARRRVRHPVI